MASRARASVAPRTIGMGLVFDVRDVVVAEAALPNEGLQRSPLVLDVEVIVIAVPRVSQKPPSYACVGTTDVSD